MLSVPGAFVYAKWSWVALLYQKISKSSTDSQSDLCSLGIIFLFETMVDYNVGEFDFPDGLNVVS